MSLHSKLAEIKPRIERLAKSLCRNPSDLDDYVQEGMIAAWESLQKGIDPSMTFIKHRMQNYGRKVRRWSEELSRPFEP